jgi:hypothetical protein
MTAIVRTVFVALCLSALPAHAALSCSGSVSSVLILVDGLILIKPSWHTEYRVMCGTAAAWGGISPQTCKRWHAQAQLAQSIQGTLTVDYPTSSATQCSDIGADVPGALTNPD